MGGLKLASITCLAAAILIIVDNYRLAGEWFQPYQLLDGRIHHEHFAIALTILSIVFYILSRKFPNDDFGNL